MTRPLMRPQIPGGRPSAAAGTASAPSRGGRRVQHARPLVRRALAAARRVDRLAGSVTSARHRIGVGRLGERVAAARAPKLLRAATRLAPVRRPALRPDIASSPVASRSLETRYDAPSAQAAREAASTPVGPVGPVGPVAATEPAFNPPLDSPAIADLLGASPERVARTPEDRPKVLVDAPEPLPSGLPEDMHYLWNVWQREKPGARGVLERSRGARILEGPTPEGDAPAPAKLERLAREPAKDPSPEIVPVERQGPERPEAHAPDRRSADDGAMRIARTPAEPAAVEIATPQLEVAPQPAADVPVAPERGARHEVSRAPATPLRIVARVPDSEARRDHERPAPTSAPDLGRPAARAATPAAERAATPAAERPAQRPAAVSVRLARRPRADKPRAAAENETTRPRLRRAAVASPPHLTVVRSPADASPAAPAEPARPQSRSLLSRIFRRPAREDAAVAQVTTSAQISAAPIATPPLPRVGQIAQRAGDPPPLRAASRPVTSPDRPVARVSRRAAAQTTRPSVLSRQFGLPTPTLPTIPSSGFQAAASGEAQAAASNLGMPTHTPSAPSLHAPSAPAVPTPGAPSLDAPSAPSFHPPGASSFHPPGASSFQPPSAPSLHPPQIASPAMPSLAGHHGLPSIGGAAAHAAGGHASTPPAGGGDPGSDHLYRELLSRLREEQEQLGQIVDEPF